MASDREGIIEMVDEDGGVYEFEHLMTFAVDDEYFLAFAPVEDMGEFSTNDVLIMRIGEDEDGEEVYLPIESNEELEVLFEIFKQIWAQVWEEGEDDEDMADEEE